MAIKPENLARVGMGIQMGAMMAKMADSNNTGVDDTLGNIAQKIGDGCVRASTGNLKTGAGLIRAAGVELIALADELEAR